MTRKPSKKSKSNPITTTAGAHQHNTRGQRLARNTLPRPAERLANDPIVDAQAAQPNNNNNNNTNNRQQQ
jgi:hypothetical protein